MAFIKEVTPQYIENEIKLHKIFARLNIDKYFLKPIKYENNKIHYKKLNDDFHSYYKKIKSHPEQIKFWFDFLDEISFVISVLEKNHIQHNDLHFGNIMFDKNQFKIIDLETMTDYKTITPIFANYSKAEKHRMGFSDKFHIGADLNQLLGYMLEDYYNDLPSILQELMKRHVIKLDKEFPYAIDVKNSKTSGFKIHKITEHSKGYWRHYVQTF